MFKRYVAIALAGLILSGAVHAQQLIFNCQGFGGPPSGLVPCTQLGPPTVGFQGDPGYLVGGKLNTMFAQLYGVFNSFPITGPVFKFPGGNNTGVGFQALNVVAAGTGNTAVGNQTLAGVAAGSNNTAIGNQVGNVNPTTGSNNVLIGTASTVSTPAAGTSNWLNIQNTLRGGTTVLTVGGNVSACGTGPALSATATDMAGTIVTGSATTTCTITLNQHPGVAPLTCLVTSRTNGNAPAYTTTDNGTTATLVLTVASASTTYDYFCPVH